MIFFLCEHKLTLIQMKFFYCEWAQTYSDSDVMIFYQCEPRLTQIQMIVYHWEHRVTYFFRWNSTNVSPDLLEFRYSTTVSEPRRTQTEMIFYHCEPKLTRIRMIFYHCEPKLTRIRMIFYHCEPKLTRIRMICYRCEWAPAPSCEWLGRVLWRRVPSDYWPCSNRSLNCRTWLEGLYSLCCLQASC